MICELVRTTSGDGVRLDGAWFEPTAAPDGQLRSRLRMDAIIGLHGVASNFYSSGLFENLTPSLLDLGVPVLLANTRGHDTVHYSYGFKTRRMLGAAYEIVDDCRLDMAAWLDWLDRHGLRRPLFVGHSLGAIKILHGTAIDQRPEITGLIAMSAPRLSCEAFRNGSESAPFLQSLTAAQKLVREGQPEALMQSNFPFPMLITAAGYLDKYGPDENYNIFRHLPGLLCPTLLTYGAAEIASGATAFAGIDDAIRTLANSNPRLAVAVIADADHNYSGQSKPLAAAIAAWLTGGSDG